MGSMNPKQYWLEFQPCISSFGNEKLADSMIRKDIENRNEILAAVKERMYQLKNYEKPYCFFLERGLKLFAETGIVTDFPEKILRPCTVEERIYLLEQLWEACSSETQVIRVINDSVFKIPDYVTIAVSEGYGLDISVTDRTDGFTDIFIAETTLWQSFVDFIVSIYDSPLVSSKEETLELIEGYKNRLAEWKEDN